MRLRSALDRRLPREALDVALVVLGRGTLGLILAIAFGFFGWAFAWMYFQRTLMSVEAFTNTQTLATGIPVGVAAVVCWWNAETPARIRLAFAAAIVAVALVVPYVVLSVAGVETYYTLLGPSRRVSTIVLGDALAKLILSSVVAANATGAALIAYRMIRFREY